MTSDPEAVCGTCGDMLHRGECQTCLAVSAIPMDVIPAPVVPSDDHEHLHRHVDVRGFYIWHEHAHSHDAATQHDEDDYEDSQHSHGNDLAHATYEVSARGHIREPAAGAAPPTPSQDAEGGGWRLVSRDTGGSLWTQDGDPHHYEFVEAGIESSIRADYEELVKTAIREQFRCRRCKGTTEPQCVSCYDYQQCVCRPGEGSNADKCWACVDGVEQAGQQLLTRIEESLEDARMADDREYAMVAVKRDWVPEWLWWLLSRPAGSSWAPALWVWPLREILTRKVGGRS